MYNDQHRIFLYHMFKNGFVSVAKALQFCRTMNAETVQDVESLKYFVGQINKEISKQEFKIILSICEVTGEQQVILINTANDDISKLQNAFSSVELEYFQSLLNEIVTSNEKKLAQIHSWNLASTLTEKLTRTDAEKLINKWVKMGYLIIQDNDVHLGARCIIEFTSFFRAHCKDYIEICNLCSELVFSGRACASCKNVMHSHCLEKFLVKRNKCPKCKKPWVENSNETQVNESSSTDDENIVGPSKRKRR